MKSTEPNSQPHRRPTQATRPTRPTIESPNIRFEDGVPISQTFDDVYYSRAGGLAETRAIFLEQNHLPARWQALRSDPHPRPLFSVGELGFGTGLNFCATVQAFRRHAPPHARLRYYSCEQRPLRRPDLARALAHSGQRPSRGVPAADAQTPDSLIFDTENLEREIKALLEIYPPAIAGVHVLPLPLDFPDRVQLILLYGDALQSLAGLSSPPGWPSPPRTANREDETTGPKAVPISCGPGMDAWFLDGFAPARNPEIWRPELFQEVARLSAASASFATYTAAGAVRRGLIAAGFAVEKVPGFGRKREMLRGQLASSSHSSLSSPSSDRANPESDAENKADQDRLRAVVIGAGLAGTATARALIRRGYDVVLVERENKIAPGASGNPLGIAAPAATAEATPLSRLTRAGLYYLKASLAALRKKINTDPVQISGRGALLLAHKPELEQRFAAFAERHVAAGELDAETPAGGPADFPASQDAGEFARYINAAAASRICGATVTHPALYFEDAFCLSPPGLCSTLLEAARLEAVWQKRTHDDRPQPTAELRVVLSTEAIGLERRGEDWRVLAADGSLIAAAPTLVLANGPDVLRFSFTQALPLESVRGQTCALPFAAGLPALKAALCYDGYVTPAARPPGADADYFQVGATFEKWNLNPAVEPEQNRRLLERLAAVAPDFHDAIAAPEERDARAAFRTASRDRFPLIGPAPDAERWAAGSEAMDPAGYAADLPGLYLFAALGSRGLVFSGIGAEILASQIAGEALPVEADLVDALRPDRFLRRAARRQSGSRRARSTDRRPQPPQD